MSATALSDIQLITTSGFDDYALLDSGAGRKLERFGSVIVDRPEPQALWQKSTPPSVWEQAHAVFSASGDDDEKGRWRKDKPVRESWPVLVGDVTMHCRMQGLWHLGLFPEQLPHWQWMERLIARIDSAPVRVLNLFGYTGAATLLAAKAGAHVTHVDASKKAIGWGKENQAASGLSDCPVRWILDDASKFVAREVRRERTYHAILVDPPKFGRGPNNETWELFTSLPPLLANCVKLLAPDASGLVLTSYAIRASSLAFGQLLAEAVLEQQGRMEVGELAIAQSDGGRLVPTSLYARWLSDGLGEI